MRISGEKKSILAGFLAFVMLASQSMGVLAASEDQEVYEYEGTTQISSTDFYPDFDTMSSALTVEEVYIAAGSSVSEGDAVLKLTDDSYQSALDYYQAAILRAENNLTNEELTYTQGMQSAGYELDLALAKEEQASFVQGQSEAELTDTIEEHEEVLTEMEERIEALENGEYDTEEEGSEESSGGSASGGSSGASSMSGSGNATGEGLDAETLADGTETGQSEEDLTENPAGEGTAESGQGMPDGGFPGGSDGETSQTGTFQESGNLSALQSQIESLRAQIEAIESRISGLCNIDTDEDKDVTELESELDPELESELETELNAVKTAESEVTEKESEVEEAAQEVETEYDIVQKTYDQVEEDYGPIRDDNKLYNEKLDEIYVFAVDGYDGIFLGAVNPFIGTLAKLAGKDPVKTGSSMEPAEETTTEAPTVFSETDSEVSQPETPQTEAAQTEAPQTEAPQTEAPQTEPPQTEAAQPQTQKETSGSEETAVTAQKDSGAGTAQTESQGTDAAETAASAEASVPETLSDEPEEPLEQLMGLIGNLYEQERDRNSAYTIFSDDLDIFSKAFVDYTKALEAYSKALDDYSEALETLQSAKEDLAKKLKETVSKYQEEIVGLKAQIEGLEESLYQSALGQIQSLEQENAALKEQAEKLEESATADTADLSAFAGAAGSAASEMADRTQMDLSSLSGLTGDSDDLDTSALSALSGMSGMSGMSDLSALSGLTDASALTNVSGLTGVTQQMAADSLVSGVQGLAASQNEDSMFGNTYDLSEAWALLERTATDADEAEELLEELYKMLENVQFSYEELLRRKDPLELEIQYQYDTTVLSARLAEVTYEQTTRQLEEELQSVEDTLSDLKEEQLLLESLEDGTVRAAASGTVSAVNYEADDTLISLMPMYSIYDTDVVTVWITVPQSEIANIAVGDEVEVSLGGMSTVTGTVTEKAVEAQEGNSRTTINYEVEISIDNTTGRLSSGTSATVTVTV